MNINVGYPLHHSGEEAEKIADLEAASGGRSCKQWMMASGVQMVKTAGYLWAQRTQRYKQQFNGVSIRYDMCEQYLVYACQDVF
jgi:hypothetical protein